MLIFRVEHKREHCGNDSRYKIDGTSATGHGTYKRCYSYNEDVQPVPNFGLAGSPPWEIMEHERCAVTAEQWHNWIGTDYSCLDRDSCFPDDSLYNYCKCPPRDNLSISDEWHIVCYDVEDDSEGIDWRIDNGQVVFNPAFALCVGTVTETEVLQFLYA